MNMKAYYTVHLYRHQYANDLINGKGKFYVENYRHTHDGDPIFIGSKKGSDSVVIRDAYEIEFDSPELTVLSRYEYAYYVGKDLITRNLRFNDTPYYELESYFELYGIRHAALPLIKAIGRITDTYRIMEDDDRKYLVAGRKKGFPDDRNTKDTLVLINKLCQNQQGYTRVVLALKKNAISVFCESPQGDFENEVYSGHYLNVKTDLNTAYERYLQECKNRSYPETSNES